MSGTDQTHLKGSVQIPSPSFGLDIAASTGVVAVGTLVWSLVPVREPPPQAQNRTVAQEQLGTQTRDSGEETSHPDPPEGSPKKGSGTQGQLVGRAHAQVQEECIYIPERMYTYIPAGRPLSYSAGEGVG